MATTLPQFTLHAKKRTSLFSSFVDQNDIVSALQSIGCFPVNGQTYVKVKTLRDAIKVVDLNGEEKYGDTIYAVVDRTDANDCGRVVTIMLRYASSQMNRFFRPSQTRQ